MYCPWRQSQHSYTLSNPGLVSSVILSSFPSSFSLSVRLFFFTQRLWLSLQVKWRPIILQRKKIFFEAARGFDLHASSLGQIVCFRDWQKVKCFLDYRSRDDGSRDDGSESWRVYFLVVPVKNGTTSSLFKDKIHSILPLGGPVQATRRNNHGIRGHIEGESVLLESPSHCMPYVYLSLSRVHSRTSKKKGRMPGSVDLHGRRPVLRLY